MIRNPLFEAGVGVAYEADKAFDKAIELHKTAGQLAVSADSKLDRAQWAESALGIPFDPNQDVDIDQFIIHAEAKAEADRWASLCDSAEVLFIHAENIEKLEQKAA